MKKKHPYLGSKTASGTLQMLINHMPKHKCYVEPFVGSGAVVLNKKPALSNFINDYAAAQSKLVASQFIKVFSKQYGTFSNDHIDAIEYISKIKYINSGLKKEDIFIYCDPPYVLSTRTGKDRYKYEYSDTDHVNLINVLKTQNAHVMLSGYPSALYDDLLSDWKTVEFQAMTRGGMRTEKLWMNYDINTLPLHQTNHLGKDFSDRQRIKRKVQRITRKIKNLPKHERQAVLEKLSFWTT